MPSSRVVRKPLVAVVWTLKDGKVIREEQYVQPVEAMEAVGLPLSAR